MVQTLRWLQGAVNEDPLRPFGAQIWREIGAQLEGLGGGTEAALGVFPTLPLPTLTLRDALSIAATRPD